MELGLALTTCIVSSEKAPQLENYPAVAATHWGQSVSMRPCCSWVPGFSSQVLLGVFFGTKGSPPGLALAMRAGSLLLCSEGIDAFV